MKDNSKPETQNPKLRRAPRRPVGAWLTAEETRWVNETLGGLNAESPVVRAVELLLAGFEAGEVAVALNPSLTPDQRQFAAGTAFAVSQIRDVLDLARDGKLEAWKR